MDTKTLKPLLDALDDGYRTSSHEMLRYFLSSTLSLFGLPEWQTVPDNVQPKIVKAIEAYAAIVKNQPPFMDVLGPLYMEMASHGSRQMLAQYFSPWPIASMMARMTAGDPPPDDGDLIRACDPACGSGVMMLAFANQVMTDWGADSLKRLSLTGCDLDSYCSRMMAAQLIANCNIHNVQLGEILVLRGNSLFPDQDMETIVHATAPSVRDVLPARHPARLQALAAAGASHPDLYQPDFFEVA
jgi:hypothetical protein